MTPHYRYTLPPKQAKIVLKSVFLNKINTLSVVILWLLHFGHQKFYDPLFFFPRIYDPPVYLGTHIPKTMMAPLAKHVSIGVGVLKRGAYASNLECLTTLHY